MIDRCSAQFSAPEAGHQDIETGFQRDAVTLTYPRSQFPVSVTCACGTALVFADAKSVIIDDADTSKITYSVGPDHHLLVVPAGQRPPSKWGRLSVVKVSITAGYR